MVVRRKGSHRYQRAPKRQNGNKNGSEHNLSFYLSWGVKILLCLFLFERILGPALFSDDKTTSLPPSSLLATTTEHKLSLRPASGTTTTTSAGSSSTGSQQSQPAAAVENKSDNNNDNKDNEDDDASSSSSEDSDVPVYRLGGPDRKDMDLVYEVTVGAGEWGPRAKFLVAFATEEESEKYHQTMTKIMETVRSFKKKYGKEHPIVYKEEVEEQYIALVRGAIDTFGADMIPYNIQHTYNEYRRMLGMELQKWPPLVPVNRGHKHFRM
jgi:hypothetical protein